MNIAAVSSVLSSVSATSTAAPQTAANAIGDFSALLEGMGSSAIGKLQIAEQKSLEALSGQGSTREVVDAMMSAEQTLQIAVGVRDKIVSAYLELSRMAI